MPVIRSLEALTVPMRRACECFELKAREMVDPSKQFYGVYRVETLRTQGVQTAYYAQSRQALAVVNELRAKEGLYLLTEAENKKTVTNTLKSNHADGNAADYCPLTADGNLWWNAPDTVWQYMGQIAEECGLDWCAGGKGQHWGWDSPHMELMKRG